MVTRLRLSTGVGTRPSAFSARRLAPEAQPVGVTAGTKMPRSGSAAVPGLCCCSRPTLPSRREQAAGGPTRAEVSPVGTAAEPGGSHLPGTCTPG